MPIPELTIVNGASSGRLVVPAVAVIIPTYYEANNLPEVISRIDSAMKTADIDTEIVVVDDNSQDGTERICKELSARHPVNLLTRKHERGLASAVLHGIKHSESEFIAVMDADLSHAPEDLPRLIQCLRDGRQFVIGSRYVKGGTTDATWSMYRWVNSKVATLLARGLTDIKDPMSGFFAFPRQLLQQAPSLLPVGYKIGLEILIKTGCRDVVEIPIAFMERTRGESKLTLQQQLNYLRHLRRLYQYRFPRGAEFAHFISVGGTGVVVDFTCYVTLVYLVGMNHQVARAISFLGAASWNWFLNRWFTFVAGREKPPGRQWLEFVLAASLGFSINWGSYKILTDYNAYFMSHHLAGFFAGICLGMVFNYTVSRVFVFRSFAVPIGGADRFQQADRKDSCRAA